MTIGESTIATDPPRSAKTEVDASAWVTGIQTTIQGADGDTIKTLDDKVDASAWVSYVTVAKDYDWVVGSVNVAGPTAAYTIFAVHYATYSGSGNATISIASKVEITFPMAFTVKDFAVRFDTAPGAGETYTITVYKNDAATDCSAVVSEDATAGSNLTDVEFSAGDGLAVLVAPSTSAASTYAYINVRVRET